jgi:uncharacterized membrane protein YqjE
MTVDQPPAGTSDPGASPPGSLLDHLRELLSAALQYLQARLSLAGIEAKEALLHFGLIIALFVIAGAVSLLGYLFLCIALTILIAHLLGVSPGWVILALGLLHFIIAAAAILFAVYRLKTAVFAQTLAEFQKDQQWLNQSSK